MRTSIERGFVPDVPIVPVVEDVPEERFGITHEKFVKVSVFSVYYLPSDPIDASINSVLAASGSYGFSLMPHFL